MTDFSSYYCRLTINNSGDFPTPFKKFEVILTDREPEFLELRLETLSKPRNSGITPTLLRTAHWHRTCSIGALRGQSLNVKAWKSEGIGAQEITLAAPTFSSPTTLLRPQGYSFTGNTYLTITAEIEGFEGIGYGEGSSELAMAKARSEAVERACLKWFVRNYGGPESSNGWATHIDRELAIRNAFFELMERDIALTAWETGGPFFLVPDELWPAALTSWTQTSGSLEFGIVRVLISFGERGACISVLLMNRSGRFVAGHAASLSLSGAIESAANEAFRAAHSALQFDHFATVRSLHNSDDQYAVAEPGAHSVAYAYNEVFPEEVAVSKMSAREIKMKWSGATALKPSDDAFTMTIFKAGPFITARLKSSWFREMYWGQAKVSNSRNKRPHFVG